MPLDKRSKSKILWVLKLISELDIVPSHYFKQLKGIENLYEVRARVGSNSYRVFCFHDGIDKLILANGFLKKSNKTPKKEIQKAIRIKEEYYGRKG